MKPDRSRLLGYLWLIVLGATLLVSAAGAYTETMQIEEYAWGCDPFGYLRMAKEMRRAAARGEFPDYRIETPQSRLLIEHMKSLDRPERGWGEMVAPHAHHYFHQPDHIAVQYPPGTGAALALYPEGRAVHGMCRTVIGLCVGAGILTLIVSAVTRAWAGAGGVVFALDLALKILGDLGGLSFSIHVVLAPLLAGFILLFLSLILRSAAGCFRISAALAFLAGIALSFAILVRLPVLFLLPGISLLLFGTTRRTCINTGLIAFCLGFAFGGVFPLLWHQHEVAGAWYLATYGSDDNSSPSLAVLEQNSLFYLWGGPGSQYNWALWVSFIGFVGLTITTHRSAAPVSWMRTLMAAALIWGTSTAYFLTHKIAIPYYQIPAMFAVLVLLALSGLTRQVLHDKPQERGDGIPSSRSWNVIARLAGAMAFLPGLAALEIAWAARPQAPLSVDVSPHQVVFPPELTAPSAWVYADLMTGSLWYYAEKPSYKILFADGATRAQAYRFAFERGEPQYVIRDSEGMQSAIAEIERMGAILIPRGMVDNYPYFLVRWPAAGPRSEHLLNRQ